MERSHILNMLYAFSLGFFSIRLSVALGLLLIVDTVFRMRVGKPSGRLIFSTLLLIMFVVLFYIIGWGNLPDGSLIERFVFIIFTLFIASLLSIRIKDDELLAVLSAFVYGMLIYSVPIVVFSLLKGGYGYGSLYNPWTLMEMNSPSVSNDFALVSAFLILFGLEKWKLTSSILLVVVSFCGVYVGGRTFLLIYMLSLFLFTFNSVSSRRLLIITPFFILLTIAFFISGLDKLVFSRFYEMGLESARFDMFIQAFRDIPDYPYGGFEPDVYSYKGEWFHNFYLDTASTSGWYPLFVSLFTSAYILTFIYRYHHKKFFYLFLIVVLIMSQDVIMEANLKPFLFFIILSSLLFRRNLKEKLYLND
ncbi:hypothetical protein [Vibrio splendidus]|uniref:hypothetical protein n=1 Tax=Vibrio splendidus TaxID=29497 RepID=UPI00246959C2|nr:hypothetical protein [Vibrio splendidus]MDH6018070.1 hypothetical protein [Vibrio splendidus]